MPATNDKSGRNLQSNASSFKAIATIVHEVNEVEYEQQPSSKHQQRRNAQKKLKKNTRPSTQMDMLQNQDNFRYE